MAKSPFDYLNAVSYTKDPIIHDEDTENDYPPFLVNKGLSLHIDTIENSNIMNMNHDMDKKLQFDYLLNSIRKRKRKSEWFKKKVDSDIEVVMEYYSYNLNQASDVLSILSTEQLNNIREILDGKR